jgi:hypothetical protein
MDFNPNVDTEYIKSWECFFLHEIINDTEVKVIEISKFERSNF